MVLFVSLRMQIKDYVWLISLSAAMFSSTPISVESGLVRCEDVRVSGIKPSGVTFVESILSNDNIYVADFKFHGIHRS